MKPDKLARDPRFLLASTRARLLALLMASHAGSAGTVSAVRSTTLAQTLSVIAGMPADEVQSALAEGESVGLFEVAPSAVTVAPSAAPTSAPSRHLPEGPLSPAERARRYRDSKRHGDRHETRDESRDGRHELRDENQPTVTNAVTSVTETVTKNVTLVTEQPSDFTVGTSETNGVTETVTVPVTTGRHDGVTSNVTNAVTASRASEREEGEEKREKKAEKSLFSSLSNLSSPPSASEPVQASLPGHEATGTKDKEEPAAKKTPRPKPEPKPDPEPESGTLAARVCQAIREDSVLGPITAGPGEFSLRVCAEGAYPRVDILAEVHAAAEYASRTPGKYVDGRAFLSRWLRTACQRESQRPTPRPSAPGPAPVSQSFDPVSGYALRDQLVAKRMAEMNAARTRPATARDERKVSNG